MATVTRGPRPDWLKVRLPSGDNSFRLKGILRGLSLNTVCEEARCPNVAECWGQGTATFMILGDVCTRACGFCAVKTGLPQYLDREEPLRVAEAVSAMGLAHAVVTSVNRDEQRDGGASIFAATIEAIRSRCPETTIEVLIPDFKGSRESLETVLTADRKSTRLNSSHSHLVCRLLLEKKKQTETHNSAPPPLAPRGSNSRHPRRLAARPANGLGSSEAVSTAVVLALLFLFFFNDTATTEIYTLSLHDALPISSPSSSSPRPTTPTAPPGREPPGDRKSTRLNSSHSQISYAVFCLKKKNKQKFLCISTKSTTELTEGGEERKGKIKKRWERAPKPCPDS